MDQLLTKVKAGTDEEALVKNPTLGMKPSQRIRKDPASGATDVPTHPPWLVSSARRDFREGRQGAAHVRLGAVSAADVSRYARTKRGINRPSISVFGSRDASHLAAVQR